jgi:hypothetical protein
MPPITVEAPFPDDLGVVARQIPPIALPLGRAKAGRQRALAHSVGQPTGIGLIGLAPRHLLHMGGIDQAHRNIPFQEIQHRLPILTAALHGHRGDPGLHQSAARRQQVDGHGPTLPAPHDFVGLPHGEDPG